MKRRKKLWIACAALAVVVALCAGALLYRPVPYRFLEGSRYEKTDVDMHRLRVGTYRAYRVNGTMSSVTARAKSELAPQDGWEVYYVDHQVTFKQGDNWVLLTSGLATAQEWFPDEPGTVSVVVIVEKPTFIGRLHAWLENR